MNAQNANKAAVKSPRQLLRASIALVGQQNSGKSTLFNALTRLNQHVANYPGVTIEKKSGFYKDESLMIEVVDLPGIYNLTSFSPEERVARNFLLNDKADLIVNVLDASHLRRSLHLTVQLIEAGFPMICVLNMVDVAERLGETIDVSRLSAILGIPVISAVARRNIGVADIKTEIREFLGKEEKNTAYCSKLKIDYGELEQILSEIETDLREQLATDNSRKLRWFAIKLAEGDEGIREYIERHITRKEHLDALLHEQQIKIDEGQDEPPMDVIAKARSTFIENTSDSVTQKIDGHKISLSDRIDSIVLNRWIAPVFLMLTIWTIYQLSIVQGYELTKVTWPFLARFKIFMANVLPSAGFLYDPEIRSFGLWLIDSVNTLLNYVPIFLILFALIAILEDSGYMARIAFIFDRILHRFGLHGQSTLPYILAGVFAGGCAVPGVMATKGIPDNRARMATILTVPYMNCLAKIPLYTLLINIYFAEHKGLVLFFISTITVIAALLIAKLLTTTVLKKNETAPFIMELPHYHPPTISGVLRRSVDRTWIYIKKVGTIVVAIAAVVYALLQFPGLSEERESYYENRGTEAISTFYKTMEGNQFLNAVSDQQKLVTLLNVATDYRSRKMNAQGAEASAAVDRILSEQHSEYVPFILRGKSKEERQANQAMRALDGERRLIRQEMRQEKIQNSLLGRIGKAMEPVTQFANFDWKINVALLSSFAARESSVATLGVLFEQPEGDVQTLEERMGSERNMAGYTAMSALALILFFALYPPCLATMIIVRVQTNSYLWMLFAIIFPTVLGLMVASLTYTIGTLSGLSSIQMMMAIYVIALLALLIIGFDLPSRLFRHKQHYDKGL